MRRASSPANFKNKLSSRVRPSAKAVFRIYDPIALSYLAQLRVDPSNLSLHKFQHSCRDILNPMCPTSDGIEDAEHFLLQSPSFIVQQRNLLAKVIDLLCPFIIFADLSNEAQVQLLIYGDNDLPNDVNRAIPEFTLRFIYKIGRFG